MSVLRLDDFYFIVKIETFCYVCKNPIILWLPLITSVKKHVMGVFCEHHTDEVTHRSSSPGSKQ